MKKILYMATSLDGYIATLNNKTPWSKAEWKSYAQKVKEIGNIIIGWNTYQIMKKFNEFKNINYPTTIILTHQKIKSQNKFYFVNSPHQALQLLEKLNFKKTLIAGGGQLNTSFLKLNLIDEIFIDLEPFIFGDGLKLFSTITIDKKLKLISANHINRDTLQLHYKFTDK
jgi:dihydrofolate reductase